MAGGTWSKQEKILPGFYLNIKSAPKQALNYGDRGVCALCKPMSWGPVGQILPIGPDTDVYLTLGYPLDGADETLFLRECFRGSVSVDGAARTTGAAKVLLYRPAADGACKAAATVGSGETALTVTARWPGLRGNSIAVSMTAQPDQEGAFAVSTTVDGTREDSQTVTDLSQLKSNLWVDFSGEGIPAAAAVTPLAGGLDGTVESTAQAAFLEALEPYTFQVVVYDGEDATVQAAMAAFVRRLRENEGRKVQVVMPNGAKADYEGVISVANGLLLKGGVQLTAGQACWWVAGCTAGAKYNQSLTYAVHPEAVDVSPKYTSGRAGELIHAGNLVLTEEEGTVRVFCDVNTLTTFTTDKAEAFSKNRPIRVLDTVANDLYRIFSSYHLGRTDNNTDGRNLLKKEIVGMMNAMQAEGGVQHFAADDITVAPGEAADAVVIILAVQPVDAVEKIYMTVTVS